MYDEFTVDKSTRIAVDSEAGAIYIYLHGDQVFPAVVPTTETLNQSPLVNVDRIGDTVIGIEIEFHRS